MSISLQKRNTLEAHVGQIEERPIQSAVAYDAQHEPQGFVEVFRPSSSSQVVVRVAGCVERVQWDYRFTAYGWLKALEAAGRLGDTEMKEKLGTLTAAMKRRCEEGGRHRDGSTIQELAQETDFSEDWIYNVVESHLMRRLQIGSLATGV